MFWGDRLECLGVRRVGVHRGSIGGFGWGWGCGMFGGCSVWGVGGLELRVVRG